MPAVRFGDASKDQFQDERGRTWVKKLDADGNPHALYVKIQSDFDVPTDALDWTSAYGLPETFCLNEPGQMGAVESKRCVKVPAVCMFLLKKE